MAYNNILIIGGSGFIGSQVVAQLARSGASRVTVPTRRYESSKHLLVMPTVRTVITDVHDETALDGLFEGVDAVVNLVGILQSRRGPAGSAYGPDFARAHVALPQKLLLHVFGMASNAWYISARSALMQRRPRCICAPRLPAKRWYWLITRLRQRCCGPLWCLASRIISSTCSPPCKNTSRCCPWVLPARVSSRSMWVMSHRPW